MEEYKIKVVECSKKTPIYLGIKKDATFRLLRRFLSNNYNIPEDELIILAEGHEKKDDEIVGCDQYSFNRVVNFMKKKKELQNQNDAKARSNGQFSLSFLFTDNVSYSIRVSPNQKWSEVKNSLQQQSNIPAVELRLIHMQHVLEDDSQIKNSNVFEMSKILVSRQSKDSILNEVITEKNFRFTCRFCETVGAAIKWRYICPKCGKLSILVDPSTSLIMGQSTFRDLLRVRGECTTPSCSRHNKVGTVNVSLYCKECPNRYQLEDNIMFYIPGGCEESQLIFILNSIYGYVHCAGFDVE
ncbi:hypothetical protein WA158_001316 [Blastocystis sp. Blastoise]